MDAGNGGGSKGAKVAEATWAERDALPTLEPRPGITVRSVAGAALHVVWVAIAPDTELPAHRHPHEQIGTILEGAIEITIAGETRRVGPGASYVVPGGVEHGGRTGPEGVLALEVFTPLREDYLVS